MKQYFIDLKLSILTGGYLVISFTNVDFAMKAIAFVVATGYTIRRWYFLEKNKKE